MKLTVLGDERDATFDHDGDAVLRQLLVAKRSPVGSGGERDGGKPQRKVHPVEAVDVNRPRTKKERCGVKTHGLKLQETKLLLVTILYS